MHCRKRHDRGRGRIDDGARDVTVDKRRVELAEPLPERLEAHIGLVVAEARVVDADRVEHLDHAAAAVQRREHGWREKITS